MGIGALGLILLAGLLALGVLLVRLGARSGPRRGVVGSGVIGSGEGGERGVRAEAGSGAERGSGRGTEVMRPAGVRPGDVDFEIVSQTGLGPRTAIDALLERARPAMARCAVAERAVHVSVQLVATWGGTISVSQPHPQRPSDDEAVARCVAEAISAAGPAAFTGVQSAIVGVDVDLPAGG